MAGFLLNILSEQTLGTPVNIQSNAGDFAVYGQFKQLLQQASLESVDLKNSFLMSSNDLNSGKDLPFDLSFSAQPFAAGLVFEGDNQESEWSDFPAENKIIVESGDFSDLSEFDLDAELIAGFVNPDPSLNPEIITNSESSLTPEKMLFSDLQPSSNNSPNVPGVNSVINLLSSHNKIVADSEFTINRGTLQKGAITGASIAGQSIHSNPQDQLIQPIELVAKAVEKLSLAESTQQKIEQNQSKPLIESGLQNKRLRESKFSDPMKSNALIEEGDLSEILKPENSKLNRVLSKLEQADSLPKTEIGQMATQLKDLKLIQKTIAASNSNKNAFSISEQDSVSPINKLTVAANTEIATTPAKVSENIIANSAIQSGLSLKRNFSPNLAARIQWIYHQAISSAEILMDPPELGPLSVKLTNNKGETNVLFQVSNPFTKEAIEENLAKLKELLSEQGINLGDTQVEQQQKNDKKENSKEQIVTDSSLKREQHNEQGEVQAEVGLLDTYI